MSRKVRTSSDQGSLVDGRTVSHLAVQHFTSYQLGERLGTPIAISPTEENPTIAKDPEQNNFFDFSSVSRPIIAYRYLFTKISPNSQPKDQSFCPFAAHIRKTNPRSDLPAPAVAQHAINRHGIPFGPEVTTSEHSYHKTQYERGLAFVCYQSDLQNGFEFQQISTSILVFNSIVFLD